METANTNLAQKQPHIQSNVTEDPISSEPNIHQKRITLEDPTDPKKYLLTSILIYISHHYPRTKHLLKNMTAHLLAQNQSNLHLIYECSKTLSEDVQRQIIYGPSTTYIPPSEITHINRLDTSLINVNHQTTVSLKEILLAHSEMNLDVIIPTKRVHQMLWYSRSKTLSNNLYVNNRYPSKELRAQLEIGGQNWLDATPLAALFITLKNLWKQLITFTDQKPNLIQIEQKILLLLGRFSFLHNKILTNPVKQLADDVFNYYEAYIINMFKQNSSESLVTANDYVRILAEYTNCLLFYYKYKKCQRLMSKCCEVLEMEMEFTGKLGRRTKYQSFDCAQLIMSLKRKTNLKVQEIELTQNQKQEQQEAQKLTFPDAKKLIAQEVKNTAENQSVSAQDNIKQSQYDQENILLEKPLLTEPSNSNQEQFALTRQKLTVALTMINYTYSTVPHDEMLYQYISTSVSTILNNLHLLTFPLQFSSLLLRSFNEFSRVKGMQRAIEQLETLKNQYDLKQHKNVDILFSTPYLTRMEFIMKFAHKYMDIQMALTAVNLLKKAGMYEQCIDGLIQRDYKEKALELVTEILEQKGKTPRLLCMLGDIHKNDPKFYEEAWTLSQKRYGRAMRSLGWVYFNKDDFKKAAQCFSNATQVNYYNPNTWFTLGCCYIRMEQFDKALRPFGESVRIDQTQGEAWGNIATCYIQMKKMKEAYSTLEQAVKHAEGNWKIWSNLLSVSLSLKQFYKFFQCIERLVRLEHSELLTKQTMSKIQQVMKFKLYEAMDGKIRKRIAFNFKNRIDRLFGFLETAIGQNPIVWQAKTSYLEVVLEYEVEMYKYYYNLHKEGKIDPNDLLDGFETEGSMQQHMLIQTAFLKDSIVECKQKQLNMMMKIGWEDNKIESQKVLNVLRQYILVYQKYNSQQNDYTEFTLFVKGLKDKIQKCLENQISLPNVQKK